MGQQHNTHIANDTDEDLTMTVLFSGKSGSITVRAHQYHCVQTDYYQPINSVGFNASSSGGGANIGINDYPDSVVVRLPTGEWRAVRSDYSILIRKRGSQYLIYQVEYGKIWQIDQNNLQNQSMGL